MLWAHPNNLETGPFKVTHAQLGGDPPMNSNLLKTFYGKPLRLFRYRSYWPRKEPPIRPYFLKPEVGECFIRLRHPVGIVFTLNRRTLI
jgi:hypothetical protein